MGWGDPIVVAAILAAATWLEQGPTVQGRVTTALLPHLGPECWTKVFADRYNRIADAGALSLERTAEVATDLTHQSQAISLQGAETLCNGSRAGGWDSFPARASWGVWRRTLQHCARRRVSCGARTVRGARSRAWLPGVGACRLEERQNALRGAGVGGPAVVRSPLPHVSGGRSSQDGTSR